MGRGGVAGVCGLVTMGGCLWAGAVLDEGEWRVVKGGGRGEGVVGLMAIDCCLTVMMMTGWCVMRLRTLY